MRHRLIICAVGLVLTFGIALPRASADQTFHTERIPLLAIGGAPLHSGFVIDVHANGPIIFAQERYVLVGALPNATYQVQLLAHLPSDASCSSASLIAKVPEATLLTNAAGNGEAGFTFAPPGPPSGTYNLQWQVLNGGAVAYQTACTPVAVE